MRTITNLADAATAWRDAEEGLKQARCTFDGAMSVRSDFHKEDLAAYKRFQGQCRVTDKLLKRVTELKREVAQAAERWGELKAVEKKDDYDANRTG